MGLDMAIIQNKQTNKQTKNQSHSSQEDFNIINHIKHKLYAPRKSVFIQLLYLKKTSTMACNCDGYFLYVTFSPLNVDIFYFHLLYEKAKSQNFDDRKLTFKFKNLIFPRIKYL